MKEPVYYLICSAARSGSTYLCDLMYYAGLSSRNNLEQLSKGAVLGKPWQDGAAASQIKAIFDAACTPAGIGGFKIMYGQFEFLYHEIIKLNSYRHWQISDMAKLFPPQTKYIFLHRRDKIREAISMTKMTQGLVSSIQQTPRFRRNEIHFDLEAIKFYLWLFTWADRSWRNFFKSNNIVYHELIYEDYISSPRKTLVDLCRYLGISEPSPLVVYSPLTKLSDKTTEAWLKRYRRTILIDQCRQTLVKKILPLLYELSHYFRRYLPFYGPTLNHVKKKLNKT